MNEEQPITQAQVKRLIEQVLEWKCFDEYQDMYNELWKTGEKGEIGHPRAYWEDQGNEGWHVFYQPDMDAERFDPLKSLDDAWQIVRALNKPIGDGYARYAAFIDALEEIVGSHMFFDLFYCDPNSDDMHLTPERICRAALKAIEVER